MAPAALHVRGRRRLPPASLRPNLAWPMAGIVPRRGAEADAFQLLSHPLSCHTRPLLKKQLILRLLLSPIPRLSLLQKSPSQQDLRPSVIPNLISEFHLVWHNHILSFVPSSAALHVLRYYRHSSYRRVRLSSRLWRPECPLFRSWLNMFSCILQPKA